MFECAKQNDTYLADAIIPLYTPNFQIFKEFFTEDRGSKKSEFGLQQIFFALRCLFTR